jgi:hydrogenase maturation factor
MCLTYPGLVVAVDEVSAVVRGEHRDYRASTILVPDLSPGDYVVVAAGTILERLDPTEAAEMRAFLAGDVAPSGRPADTGGM